MNSPLFPMPQGPDPLMNLFNLTSQIGTDGQFVYVSIPFSIRDKC